MTTLPSHVFPAKPDSVGCSVPGGQIEIVDENGALLSPETVGRIVYRGPNVMWGYATSRACLARGDELNGRLETGDMGRLDADGYLYIIGRNQRFAKIAGLRIGIDENSTWLCCPIRNRFASTSLVRKGPQTPWRNAYPILRKSTEFHIGPSSSYPSRPFPSRQAAKSTSFV
jgi:hypothetical protein